MAAPFAKWLKWMRRALSVIRSLSVAIYALFVLYRFSSSQGNAVINALLIAFSVFYLVIEIYDGFAAQKTNGQKMVIAVGKPLYRMFRFFSFSISVFFSVMGIINAGANPTFWSIFLSVCLCLLLVMEVLIDAVVILVTIFVQRWRRMAMGYIRLFLPMRNARSGKPKKPSPAPSPAAEEEHPCASQEEIMPESE